MSLWSRAADIAARTPESRNRLVDFLRAASILAVISAMTLMIGLAVMLGNAGLGFEPGTAAWWLVRPVWLAVYIATLAALMPLVARFERLPAPAVAAVAWRQAAGALLVCVGLALLAHFGLGGDTALATQAIAVLLPLSGAGLAGLFRASAAATRPA